MPYEHQEFERERLYNEVWSEPVSKVAKKYNISDVGLRKICISLDIPIPPLGYWAKVSAGKAVKRPPLTPTKGSTTYRRRVLKDPLADELARRTQVNVDEDAARAPDVRAITLRSSIDECQPLVKRMAKRLDGKQRDSRSWPYCEGAGLMEISVSPQNTLRALLALNQLLETLLAAGYLVSSGRKENDPAHTSILGVRFTFRVKERSRQESIPLGKEQKAESKRIGFARRSQDFISHPTNELEISAFALGNSHITANIVDTRSLPVETKIQGFVGRLRHLVIRNSVHAEMLAEQRVIAAAAYMGTLLSNERVSRLLNEHHRDFATQFETISVELQ
jgi:hypothetical protein